MTGPAEPDLVGGGVVALAQTRLTTPAATPPHRRIPSLYADPAAWAVLAAVDRVWLDCPDRVRAAPEVTATVLVSASATTDTLAGIARAVPGGRLSPLRFAGSSPGGLISLACLVHRFRGPSLVLTTDPADGVPAARTVAGHWLRTAAARYVVVATHDRDPELGHRVRCAVVGALDAAVEASP